MPPSLPPIHIVCGATASGKSARALELCRELDGIVINADSQQLYRELRILTARPSAEDEASAPHRLYGILPASEAGSAGIWLKYARMEIDWARISGKTPIVTGGTGLYLHALMHGIARIPDVPPFIRAQAEADHAAMGGDAFRERLGAVDALSAEAIRPGDPQRLVRAYAVWLATGKSLSWWKENQKETFYNKELFQIHHVELERNELYRRIDLRAEWMLRHGALEEVERLLALNLDPALPAMRIIGVPELGAYLRGESTREAALARMQQMTRNYAKRQMTWFRNRL